MPKLSIEGFKTLGITDHGIIMNVRVRCCIFGGNFIEIPNEDFASDIVDLILEFPICNEVILRALLKGRGIRI